MILSGSVQGICLYVTALLIVQSLCQHFLDMTLGLYMELHICF